MTLDGKPVTEGSIQFWPQEGRPARGTIRPDGTYELSSFDEGDGAVLGRHSVTVEATRVTGRAPAVRSTEEEIAYYSQSGKARVVAAEVEQLVPERYSRRETSGLTAEVRRGENRLDFDLRADDSSSGAP